MDRDFHYYGTLAAAILSGFSAEESRTIATAAQFIDDCTETITHEGGMFSVGSKTKRFEVELHNALNDQTQSFYPIITSVYGVKTWTPTSNSDETRQIWMPFHFLPGNFSQQQSSLVKIRTHLNTPAGNTAFLDRLNDSPDSIQLLCRPCSDSASNMINYAVQSYPVLSSSDKRLALMLVGCIMHVFADTYAHQDFAGITSTKLNGIKNHIDKDPGSFTIYGTWGEFTWTPDEATMRPIRWPKDLLSNDWLNIYPPQSRFRDRASNLVNDTVNLGHASLGHMPDCSCIAYDYHPEWSNNSILRNNPQVYMDAFVDMVRALYCIKNGKEFSWSQEETLKMQNDLKRSTFLPSLKQLICPDLKTDVEIQLYDQGLCIPASSWFTKSEQRWAGAISQNLTYQQSSVPGYNEAKHAWPTEFIELFQTGFASLDSFRNSDMARFTIAAKLLFRQNYYQLLHQSSGIGRIIRANSLSRSMNPRECLIDEYHRYWRPDDEAAMNYNRSIIDSPNRFRMNTSFLEGSTNLKPVLLDQIKTERRPCLLAINPPSSADYLYLGAVERQNSDFYTYACPNASADQKRAAAVLFIQHDPNPDDDSSEHVDTCLIRYLEISGANLDDSFSTNTLYMDFPTSLVNSTLQLKPLAQPPSANQQWRVHTVKDENNPGKYKYAFESNKYRNYYIGIEPVNTADRQIYSIKPIKIEFSTMLYNHDEVLWSFMAIDYNSFIHLAA